MNTTKSRRYRLNRLAFGVGTLACLVAIWDCTDGGAPQADPVLPSLTLALSPVAMEVAQGKSATVTVTVTRTNFSGPLTFEPTDEGPGGVSVQYSPSTLAAGSNTVTATVTASATAPVRTRSVEIKARSATPSLFAAEQMALSIISSAVPAVSTSLVPAQVTMYPGDRVDVVTNFTRVGGYAGTITPAVAGLPTGVSGTFLPNGSVADSYILRLDATTTAQIGLKLVQVTPVTVGIGINAPGRIDLDVRVAPDFALDKSRAQLSSVQGGSDTSTVRLALTGDPGPVTLSLSGAPAGISAVFAPNPTSLATSSVLLTASNTAPNIVAPGTYNFFVRGTATYRGATQTRDTPISYTVVAAPVGSFTIVSGDMTVLPGDFSSNIVTVNRAGGFTGPVTLAIARTNGQALPAGLTLSFDQNPITQQATTIRLNTTTATPPGTYGMTLVGTSPGIAPASTTLNVVVTAPRVATTIAATKLVNGVAQVTTAETLAPGATVALSGVVRDQANAVMGVPVVWTSSNSAVATVTPTGEVRGVAAGTTTIVVKPVDNPNNIQAVVSITVPALPTSNVTHIEIEATNTQVTAPGVQTFRARLFNAGGAQIAKDANGTVEFTSSNPAVAEIGAAGVRAGVDTVAVAGKAGGTVTITARYLVGGVFQRSDATTLVVNPAGTAGYQASVYISTGGDTRTLQRGQPVTFQLIIRNAAGALVTSGVSPVPTATSSDPNVIVTPTTIGVPGYFFTITANSNAVIGSSVLIRYDVPGAGGAIRMQIVP